MVLDLLSVVLFRMNYVFVLGGNNLFKIPPNKSHNSPITEN